MPGLRLSAALAGALALGACTVAPPTGPSVLVLPPEGKNFAQFQREDAACRGNAQQQIGYGSPQQAANQSRVGSAAVGTALGATGGGLLAGSAVGAGNAQASAGGLQQRYDAAYLQCMAASGNRGSTTTAGMPYLYGPSTYYGTPYYWGTPSYYGPYWGAPAVSLGFFGGGWGHRHHHHFGGHRHFGGHGHRH